MPIDPRRRTAVDPGGSAAPLSGLPYLLYDLVSIFVNKTTSEAGPMPGDYGSTVFMRAAYK